MPAIPRPAPRHRPRARLATVAVATIAVLAPLLPSVVLAPPAGAEPITTADISGRGWGHGRGMSQYGAFGYARDFGWSTDQILDHYYGGTRAGHLSTTGGIPIPDPNRLRIRLMGLDGEVGTLVGAAPGSILGIVEEGEPTVPEDAGAVRMLRDGERWTIASAESCAGPWTDLGQSTGDTVTIRDTSGANGLFVCRPDGTTTSYAGWLRAQVVDTTTRTINITNIEEYLRGVVPHEMPPSWHGEALKAQSVAARSYAMAGDTRHRDADGTTYADTCDTTLCQVYRGRSGQDHRTNAAIAATDGVVREFTSAGTGTEGNIARTEFSSTSGGWTAGGTFPAVEDLGDSISPVHTWQVDDVSLTPLYGLGTGDLVGIEVTDRNGLGPDGGRVEQVDLTFSGQNAKVVLTGNNVRSRLGLRSDWFTITDVTEPPPSLPPSGFSDVPEGSFYEDAVTWAREEGVTGGCTETTFCPAADVTRAQTATFLWRYQGRPAGTGDQFDDVEPDAYYADAVRWVRDQAITTGCTETEFCPNADATRAQLVTFLWRHARQPSVQAENDFRDVPEGAYYEDAVDWAVARGITTGTDETTFSPNEPVSRGQTVLFLHRYLA